MKKWMITLMLIGAMLLSVTETALAIGKGDVWQVTPMEMLFDEDCDKSSLTFEDTGSVTRATESLTWSIGAGKTKKAATAFPMGAGETITLNFSYDPRIGPVDFGLIAEDNKFYFISVDNGNINQTIQIDKRGNYYLAIRNRSAQMIEVVGFVNY